MEENSININRYINGELSGKALAIFEAKLKADKDLQDKVNMHKEIDATLKKNYLDLDDEVRAKEREKLQPVFDEISEKYFKVEKLKEANATINKPPQSKLPMKSPVIIKILFPAMLLTAAAALLLFIFNPFAKTFSPAQLADKYFEPITKNSLMGSGDTPTKSPKEQLAKASQQYENQQYDDAIRIFEKMTNENSNVYKQKANWYLALCYLKQNQPEKAKPLLEELKNNGNYKRDVKAILKQLK